jgi:hypothetical protein
VEGVCVINRFESFDFSFASNVHQSTNIKNLENGFVRFCRFFGMRVYCFAKNSRDGTLFLRFILLSLNYLTIFENIIEGPYFVHTHSNHSLHPYRLG